MHRSHHTHHFSHAFDPIASALFTFRAAALNFPSDPIAADAHASFRRYRTGRAMVAAPNLIQRHGRGLTAKITKLSAYEHGQNAATRRKHLQAYRLTPALWNGANGGMASYQSHDLSEPCQNQS